MKLPDALRRLIAPLHTPAGIFGAILIAIQLVRGGLDLASTVQFAEQVWPTLWGYLTSPLGTFLSVVIGLGLYVWGGRQATKARHPEIANADLPQETLDAISADVSQRIESVRLSTKDGLEAIWTDINDIKRQIALDLPNANTASDSRESPELVAFAAAESTRQLCDLILSESPDLAVSLTERGPERDAIHGQFCDYIDHVNYKVLGTMFEKAVATIQKNAIVDADRKIAVTPLERRPSGIDPLEWRRILITETKVRWIVEYLTSKRREAKVWTASLQPELFRLFEKTKS